MHFQSLLGFIIGAYPSATICNFLQLVARLCNVHYLNFYKAGKLQFRSILSFIFPLTTCITNVHVLHTYHIRTPYEPYLFEMKILEQKLGQYKNCSAIIPLHDIPSQRRPINGKLKNFSDKKRTIGGYSRNLPTCSKSCELISILWDKKIKM